MVELETLWVFHHNNIDEWFSKMWNVRVRKISNFGRIGERR